MKRGVLAAIALIPVLFALSARAEAPTTVAVGARLTQSSDHAELVFDLSRPVEARAYALERPERIVIDLPEVNFQLDPAIGRSTGNGDNALVKAYRFGLLDSGRSRIILVLTRPACPDFYRIAAHCRGRAGVPAENITQVL